MVNAYVKYYCKECDKCFEIKSLADDCCEKISAEFMNNDFGWYKIFRLKSDLAKFKKIKYNIDGYDLYLDENYFGGCDHLLLRVKK